jgi:uncharacterized membrane protein (DUF4010 family)
MLLFSLSQALLPQQLTPADPLLLVEKLGAAAGIGLMTGLEREWAHKEAGTRSFALVSMIGALAWLISPSVALVEVGVVVVVIVLVNWYCHHHEQTLEVTTSLALAATNLLGMLAGQGEFFAAITGGLVVTALLSFKTQIVSFASKLTIAEIRGTLLLGFVALVIYPLLPDHTVDPWGVLNPHAVWLTVVIVSGLSFVNYVLLRQLGSRGMLYSALLGGLVNSAATSSLLGNEAKQAPDAAPTVRPLLSIANAAMILRNGVLLAIFAWMGNQQAALLAAIVLGPMVAVSALLGVFGLIGKGQHPAPAEVPLHSPLSLRSVVLFAALFLGLTVLSGGAQRVFGVVGFYVVVIVGALGSAASSASLTGTQAQQHLITAFAAAIAVYGATVVGLLENLTIVGVVARLRKLTVSLGLLTLLVIAVGGVALAGVLVFG